MEILLEDNGAMGRAGVEAWTLLVYLPQVQGRPLHGSGPAVHRKEGT